MIYMCSCCVHTVAYAAAGQAFLVYKLEEGHGKPRDLCVTHYNAKQFAILSFTPHNRNYLILHFRNLAVRKRIFKRFYISVCLYVYMCIPVVHGGQKRTLEPWN